LIIDLERSLLRYNHGMIRSSKTKANKPTEPVARQDTIRRTMLSLLDEGVHSARDLSSAAGISEKEVYGHLEHIRKSLSNSGHHLLVTPAECKKCGFVFSKRERLKKPGKCPVCRGEAIRDPVFSLKR
jgi:predicted Zn-ribbon and HTH transcriptional regulator